MRDDTCEGTSDYAMMNELPELVKMFRSMDNTGEMEVRLGTWSQIGGFAAGVTDEVFHQLERDFEDASTLKVQEDWRELIDYHYVLATGERARTRVEFDRTNLTTTQSHIKKVVKRSIAFGCASTVDGADAARIACSLEEPLLNPPDQCLPTMVRMQQRKTFVDVRGDQVTWKYELSRTWNGPSLVAVEHTRGTCPPVYEVECELLHGTYLNERSDMEAASSFLLKSSLLLGETDSNAMMILKDTDCARGRKKSKRRAGRV